MDRLNIPIGGLEKAVAHATMPGRGLRIEYMNGWWVSDSKANKALPAESSAAAECSAAAAFASGATGSGTGRNAGAPRGGGASEPAGGAEEGGDDGEAGGCSDAPVGASKAEADLKSVIMALRRLVQRVETETEYSVDLNALPQLFGARRDITAGDQRRSLSHHAEKKVLARLLSDRRVDCRPRRRLSVSRPAIHGNSR